MKILLTLFFFISQANATSTFFEIDKTSGNWGVSGGALSGAEISAITSVLTQLETEGRAELDNIDPENFFKYSADSTNLAGKFVSSDHANNFSKFMVGIGVGTGLNTGDRSITDLDFDDLSGAGVQASVMGGFNLSILPFKKLRKKKGLFSLRRFDLFFNFFKYDVEQDEIKADTQSMGLKLRWRAILPKKLVKYNMLTWQGLNIQLGFQKSSLNLSYESALDLPQQQDGLFTGSFASTALIKADIDSTSIPLEISTGMQMLYFMTLYGGLAYDLNSGSGSGSGELPADKSTITITGNGKTVTTTASANFTATQDGTSSFGRYFLGLQLNLWKVKLAFQYDRALGENTHAIGAGLRFAL